MTLFRAMLEKKLKGNRMWSYIDETSNKPTNKNDVKYEKIWKHEMLIIRRS